MRPTRSGIRVVHQDLALVPDLPVLDNLFLGNPWPVHRVGAIAHRQARSRAADALAAAGAAVDPRTPAGQLGPAGQLLVAVARALLTLPTRGGFLLLDEPTARLDRPEANRVLAHARSLARERHVAVLFITHHLDEVVEHADHHLVLRDGRESLAGPTAGVTEADLVAALGGTGQPPVADAAAGSGGARVGAPVDRTATVTPARAEHGPVAWPETGAGDGSDAVVVAAGLAGQVLAGVDLRVDRGEIVGVAGVEGSGGEELVRLLVGTARPRGGTLRVAGGAGPPRDPAEAVRRGIGLVPGNRRDDGGIATLSVADNILLPRLAAFWRRGWFDRRRAAAEAVRAIDLNRVEPPEPDRPFGALSGGNQQKVVLARWTTHAAGSSSSTSRRPAWTCARAPRSTGCCARSRPPGWRCSSSRPTCVSSSSSATASSCSPTGASTAELARRRPDRRAHRREQLHHRTPPGDRRPPVTPTTPTRPAGPPSAPEGSPGAAGRPGAWRCGWLPAGAGRCSSSCCSPSSPSPCPTRS